MKTNTLLPVLLLITGAILLCSLLTYPLGHDQALFNVGGKMIYNDFAVPYRDFLDMKPPGVFYVYALTNLISDNYTFNVRFFDLLYHVVCLSILYIFLNKESASKIFATLSIFIYIVLYVSIGFWNTSGAESFSLLPSLLMFIVTFRYVVTSEVSSQKILCYSLIIGVCIFALFLFKFTFSLLVIASFASVLLFSDTTLIKKTATIIGAVVVFILCGIAYYAYLDVQGATVNLLLTLEWLPKYTSTTQANTIGSLMTFLYKDVPVTLTTTLSPVFVIILILNAKAIFFPRMESQSRSNIDVLISKILVIFCCLSLFSVLIERKLFVYHYSRIFWIVAPLISMWLLEHIEKFYQLLKSLRKSIGVLFVALFLFYSPIPRLLYHSFRLVYCSLFEGKAAINIILAGDGYDIYSAGQVSLRLKPLMEGNDKKTVFIWGNIVELYSMLNQLPPTFCITNPQFISPWTPPQWKEQLLKQLNERKPDFFVVEHNDARKSITGSSLDSYASLKEWEGLSSYLETNYHRIDSNRSFLVYGHN